MQNYVHDLSYGGELVPESLNLYLDRPVRDKSHLQAILLDACAQSQKEEGFDKRLALENLLYLSSLKYGLQLQ